MVGHNVFWQISMQKQFGSLKMVCSQEYIKVAIIKIRDAI